MAMNALIAQGVRPIGADLPQIAGMLQDKRQADTRNALMQQQADQQNQLFKQGQQDRDSKVAMAAADYVLNSKTPKDTLHQLASTNPQVASFMQGVTQEHGIDWNTITDADVLQMGQNIKAHFGAQAGISPPVKVPNTFTLKQGETLGTLGQDGKWNPVASNAEAEKFGTPFSAVGPNGPGMYERGDRGSIRLAAGPDGKPLRPYEAPKTDTATSTQLHTRPLPDGRLQDFAFDPKNPSAPLVPVGDPYTKPSNLAPKDINTARMKLTQLALARKQLEQIKSKYSGLSASGPVAGYLPTAQGQGFDAAVDAIRGTFSALTRVPGVGSMSDWEGKIQQAPLPKRSQWDSTTEQKLQQVDDLITVLERGYGQMLDEAPNGAAPKAPARPQGSPAAPAAPASQGNSAPVRVSSPAEAMRLPPGTVFITPDGRQKVR